MADKQALFQTGVPTLVERLINPICVSLSEPSERALVSGPSDACPSGFEREFEPLTDVHAGIITSSLGSHGGDICSPDGVSVWDETMNDRAHLLPSVRPGLQSYQQLGFLAWDPEAALDPPGEASVATFVADFQAQVIAAGETGCGYEAQLEAWYRFLVDPTPPRDIVREGSVAMPATDENGNIIVDELILQQRAAFLRPDSVVAIIMLTDENDCSVVDGGQGFLTAQALSGNEIFTMPAATSACDADPNDVCCRSCESAEAAPPEGCASLSDDPKCSEPASDALNLRCFNQKQRFGIDLLYPVERYIDGLTQPMIYDTHRCSSNGCALVDNPLFVRDGLLRSSSRVILAGIVGVPWQDLATPDSLEGGRLVYMSPEELEASGRWQVILGDPENRVPPGDPLMIESTDPRTGENPITKDELAPPTSTDPSANPMNGHEFVNIDDSDLQYACIFPLREPRDCSLDLSCDCAPTDLERNRPLCNPPGGGPATETQYYGKAYPGPRLLQVIKGLGSRGMPASICPKNATGDPAEPDFGYNPAVDAFVRRVKASLRATCVDELPTDVTSSGQCRVLEVGQGSCDCERPGRRTIPEANQAAVAEELAALCAEQGRDCATACACEITPLTGDALDACRTESEPSTGDGWCYISPAQGLGSAELVEHCPESQRSTVRVIGAAADLVGTELRLLCE